ncbi:MAG: hypothetical protein LC130_16655 [Bryobacterales bacterium]|jgi:hypothetical protein|nr:hypothetical protein [Bryobacterales bacterium]
MRDVPRQLTVEEVRDQFLAQVWHTIRYWQKLDNPGGDRIEGAVFSVLAILDGTAVDLPGFIVAPAPHHSDREYCVERGEDYFPEAPQVECDIAGRLHDLFFAKGRLIT